jgi:beta-glucanase (GH16 family)
LAKGNRTLFRERQKIEMKFISLSMFIFCIAVSKTFSQTLNKSSANWKLVWADEFNYNGLPDSSKWCYDVGGKGWGNNELQYYTNADTANAFVRDGELYIKAVNIQKENNAYTSVRLVTKNKGDWLNGKIEVRAELPAGRGLWPAIWMLPTDWNYGDWPKSGEIDIMENVGFKPDSIFCSIHTESFNHIIGTQKTKGIKITNPCNSFHVYGIERNQEKIKFLLDDAIVFSYSNSGRGHKEWPFNKRFHLLLNIAVGGNWGGQHGVDENIFPATMLIDYVRVYQKE